MPDVLQARALYGEVQKAWRCEMIIAVQVFRDGDCKKIKDETFHDPIDLIAWVCRCYQATRRAAQGKVINAKVAAMLELERT